MNRKILIALCLPFAVACSHTTSTDQQPTETVKKEPTPEQMQAAMEKVSAIGPNHKRLEPLVGKYKVDSKFWMKPGGEPEVATGTANFRWTLGDRYLVQDYQSKFMGQPFEGQGMFAYNNVGEQYESTWADSMGSEIMKSEGQVMPDGKIVFNGQFDCPMTNEPMKMRQVLSIGGDQHTFEMYHPAMDGSGEYKAGEITYTRIKPGKKSTAAKKAQS